MRSFYHLLTNKILFNSDQFSRFYCLKETFFRDSKNDVAYFVHKFKILFLKKLEKYIFLNS